jgi:hypothetical protein
MQDRLCDEEEGREILGGVGKTFYWKILNEIARTEPDGVKKIGRLTKPKMSALLRYVESLPNYTPQIGAGR